MRYKKTTWQVAEFIQIFEEVEEHPVTERSYADKSKRTNVRPLRDNEKSCKEAEMSIKPFKLSPLSTFMFTPYVTLYCMYSILLSSFNLPFFLHHNFSASKIELF
jgi:hypothetical protein